MIRSLEIAAEMNRKIVWMGVWQHNQRAVDFYTKWGFEIFA
jgi:ribosomal protein S18 acetylase RimI-like enzyme